MEKTRRVLVLLGNLSLENGVILDRIASLDSMDKIMEELGKVHNLCDGMDEDNVVVPVFDPLPARVFRAIFSDTEWDELCENEPRRSSCYKEVAAKLRMKRQLVALQNDMTIAFGPSHELVKDFSYVIDCVTCACEGLTKLTENKETFRVCKKKKTQFGKVEVRVEDAAAQVDVIWKVVQRNGKTVFNPLGFHGVCVASGAKIVNDLAQLEAVLCGPYSVSKSDIEHEDGLLKELWKLAERALGMAALLMYFRSITHRTAMKKSFAKAVAKVENAVITSYSQALKYEGVGLFLSQNPLFLFQTIFVTLDDFLELLEQWDSLPEKVRCFWMQDLGNNCLIRRPELVFASCCNGKDSVDEKLWSCTSCGRLFHESCAGFRKGTLCDDMTIGHLGNQVIIQMPRHCGACLVENGSMISVEHNGRIIQEKCTVGRYLVSSCCTIYPAEGDCLTSLKLLKSLSRKYFSSRENFPIFFAHLMKHTSARWIKDIATSDLRTKVLSEENMIDILGAFESMHEGRVKVQLHKVVENSVEMVNSWGSGPVVISFLGWAEGYLSVIVAENSHVEKQENRSSSSGSSVVVL